MLDIKMTTDVLAEPELSTSNIKEVHSQTSTLDQILGNEKPQIEDPLKLLTATVDVRVFKSDDTGLEDTLFYRVNFPETLFLGQDFIKLLTYARPNPSPLNIQFIDGIKEVILGDWILPDLKDDESIKRVARHKEAFDPYWTEFVERHRIAFMNAVRPLSHKEVRDLFNSQASKLISMEQAVSDLPILIKRDFQSGRYSLWDKYNSLISWFRDTQQSIARDSLRYLEYQRVISLISELPLDLRKMLIESGILNRLYNVVDVQGMAGRVKNGGDGLD